MYDTNKDGKISGEELDQCPGLKAALPRLGGGEVTAEMITNRIQEWQRTKAGRLPANCIVTRNGSPLEGAEVKFVPEKFLGDNMPTGSAKTEAGGTAKVSMPGVAGTAHDPFGLPPGFYRIEITKEGMDIPAKYNTATVLGAEIAVDSGVLQNDIPLNLEF